MISRKPHKISVEDGNRKMHTSKKALLLAVPMTLVLYGSAVAGETITYKGTGTYTAVKNLMPLAGGGAAVHMSFNTVATIRPSESGFMFGSCIGLAYLGADESYAANMLCTFTETGEDGFDIRGLGDGQTGKVEIIGGSGKWAGATGTGTFARMWTDGPRGSYEYEFAITTP